MARLYTPQELGIKPPPGGFKTGGWYQGRQYWGGKFSDPGVINPLSNQAGAGKPVSKEVIQQTDPKNWDYIQKLRQTQAKTQPSATQPFFQQVTQAQEPRSKEEVTPFLNQYQKQVLQELQAPKIKVPKADELKKALEPTTPKPEPINRVQKFEELRTTYGVQELEDKLAELKAQEEELDAMFRQQKTAEMGKPVPLNVIAGRISEEERQMLERKDYISRQKARIVDELKTKYNLISTYMNLMGLDYNDAVKAYEREFNQNLQIYNTILQYQKEFRRELEADRGFALDVIKEQRLQRESERAMAKANLQLYANAIKQGNLDYDSLPADQKLEIRKLEVKAGLPSGFLSSLQMNPKDRILAINEKSGQVLMVDDAGNFKVVQTGMRSPEVSATSTSGMTPSQRRKVVSEARSVLQMVDEQYRTIGGKVKKLEFKEDYGGDKLISAQEYLKAVELLMARTGISQEEAAQQVSQAMLDLGYKQWRP